MEPVQTIPGETGSTETIGTFWEKVFHIKILYDKKQSVPLETMDYYDV